MDLVGAEPVVCAGPATCAVADPAEARAAADRTTAFYTGTPEPGASADQRG